MTLLRIIGSSASAHVGIEYGVKGPTFATCSACSTATHAIGIARDYIENGLVDVAIAGASESVINYGTMKAWQALHVLSPEGCYPFAKKRNGTVLGEGAGVLVIEEYEHAKARGATILAELCGYGMTSDSKDMVNPDIEGPRVAMQQALEDAGLDPSDIEYLNAHGTATAINDKNETNAIKEVYGEHAYKLAISSTKSMHGHLIGGTGAVELLACIMALKDGVIAPTIGYEEPDPECALDVVPNDAREAKVKSHAHALQLTAEDFSINNDGIYSDAAADLLPLLRRVRGLRAVELFPDAERHWAVEVRGGRAGATAAVRAALARGSADPVLGWGDAGVVRPPPGPRRGRDPPPRRSGQPPARPATRPARERLGSSICA